MRALWMPHHRARRRGPRHVLLLCALCEALWSEGRRRSGLTQSRDHLVVSRGRATLKAFDIPEVLRTAGGALVADERVATDEIHHQFTERAGLARLPCLIEAQSRQLRQQIDSARRDADLQHDARLRKVALSDVGERRTEGG